MWENKSLPLNSKFTCYYNCCEKCIDLQMYCQDALEHFRNQNLEAVFGFINTDQEISNPQPTTPRNVFYFIFFFDRVRRTSRLKQCHYQKQQTLPIFKNVDMPLRDPI